MADLGWTSFFQDQISSQEVDVSCAVRVMAVHRGKISIAGDGPERLITPNVRDPQGGETHPAVGDWLLLDRETREPMRILRRQSLFRRHAPGKGRGLQLIAANVDTLFIVASCNQDFNLARLERYLVLARDVGVDPIIVLTKADLTDTAETFAEAARTLLPNLVVEIVNARDSRSVARLAAWCGRGKTVALLGSSGVGKSTLINSLRGSAVLATQAVREEDGKGRHTTTVREMHRLDQGGWLLDTPGMRELQLVDANEGLAEVFDDVIELTRSCRFANCTHGSEPNCAVQSALTAGTLDAARVERWRKLVLEEAATGEGFTRRHSTENSGRKRPQGRAY